jgi:hypothetical protein
MGVLATKFMRVFGFGLRHVRLIITFVQEIYRFAGEKEISKQT